MENYFILDKKTIHLICLLGIILFINPLTQAQHSSSSLLAGLEARAKADYKPITLEDIWQSDAFYPRSVYGLRSMNDGKHYTTSQGGTEVIQWKYETGDKVKTIFDLANTKNSIVSSFSNYAFSQDEQKILLTTDVEQIYRHSFKAAYYIWNSKDNSLQALSKNGKQQLATFSPDGTKIAFVRDNNLFIKDLATEEEKQITTDGEFNKIINGAPDWVYEEEFSFSKAFAWSPDSKKIAFYRFDEAHVKQFNMTMYESLYPEWYQFKYPKAGEANAFVTIKMYNLASKKTQNVDIGEETDQYIPRIKWTQDANILALIRLNRLQNKLELLLADAGSGKTKVILTEENDYYVDINDDLTFLEDKKHFLLTSEKDGYKHIYLYDLMGKEVRQITKGAWDVDAYLGYDEKSEQIYYKSSEKSPLQRAIYRIGLDGMNKEELSQKAGTNRAYFSKGFKYFINYHTSANTPTFVSLHDAKGKNIRTLEDNTLLKENYKTYGLTSKEFFTFTTTDDSTTLNGWMIKPPNFDKNKKYPLFMFVYGGPGSQTVTNGWDRNMVWFQMLAQKGYIVASVDNRGTGARGEAFKKMTYLQLGKYEAEDQIAAAKYLGSQNYVDSERIGIWGWSYGGYLSSLCLTKGADVFKMAIAVAPVTNWRFYDSIYTERFMRTPQENPDGYDNNSPINHVDKLKGKYLLVHGTADDNVHFQNAVEMAEKLVEQNKDFDMHYYTNKAHSLYGGNTRLHLYNKMTNFILENL